MVGQDLGEAEKTLREARLTLGQDEHPPARPQGQDRQPDPRREARSSRRARPSTSSTSTRRPRRPRRTPARTSRRRRCRRRGRRWRAAAVAGGRHHRARDRRPGARRVYAPEASARAQARPEGRQEASTTAAKGTAVRDRPGAGGTKVKAGSTVQLLVSAGFPAARLRRRQGRAADQRRRRREARPDRQGHPGREGPGLELRRRPRWRSPSEGQVFLTDPTKPDAAPIPLTQRASSSRTSPGRRPATRHVAMVKMRRRRPTGRPETSCASGRSRPGRHRRRTASPGPTT